MGCKDTLYQAGDHLFGLYLEPSEIAQFPSDVVFPLFGHGVPVEITAYQLGVNRCPNYEESGGLGTCKVYADRPLVCRAFPVLGPFNVAKRCPAVAQAVDGVDSDSLGAEIEAHRKKIECMMSRKETQWVWPLNKREWIPMERKA
jgi:Fe-S-cluster containining protein